MPLCSIRVYKIYLFGLPSATLSYDNNICQGIPLPLQHYGITSAMVLVNLHHSVHKIAGHTSTHTPSSVGILLRLTFLLRHEEAMFENGEIWSPNKI